MDCFQEAMSNLLKHIALEAEKNDRNNLQIFGMASTRSRASPSPTKGTGAVEEQECESRPHHHPADPHRQSPFTMATPVETRTFDTFPEQASTLFSKVLVLPKEYGMLRDNYDVIYASLLYNMGLVLHNYGLNHSCGSSLRKALETYEVAHGVIVHDLQRRGGAPDNDVQHWLLYALFNNMANIYNFARSSIMTQHCLERLRLVLSHSDSALLEKQDLLFFVCNLDVVGGLGVIAAGAA